MVESSLREPSSYKKIQKAGEILSQRFEQLAKSNDQVREFLKTLRLEEKISYFDSSPYISKFVTRFFPIKLIIRALSYFMMEFRGYWYLEDVEGTVYDLALVYSERLKKYEEEKNLSRNKKLSTGLLLPPSAKIGSRGRASSRMDIRLSASKQRFFDQFLGRSGKRTGNFTFEPGAAMEMGLIGYTDQGSPGEYSLTLTSEGREFAEMKNPIIDEGNFSKVFSKEEAKFIFDKIIPKFKLEKIIVDGIVERINKYGLKNTEELDIILEEEKKKFRQKHPEEAQRYNIKLLEDLRSLKICPKCKKEKLEYDEKKGRIKMQYL